MDPNLFHLDWERTAEALALIIVLSFMIERALAILFESRVFIEKANRKGLKEATALLVSIAVCWAWQFDALSIIILTERTRPIGYAITGAVIAGGSKASIKLFHDVLNVKSNALRQSQGETIPSASITGVHVAAPPESRDVAAKPRPLSPQNA